MKILFIFFSASIFLMACQQANEKSVNQTIDTSETTEAEASVYNDEDLSNQLENEVTKSQSMDTSENRQLLRNMASRQIHHPLVELKKTATIHSLVDNAVESSAEIEKQTLAHHGFISHSEINRDTTNLSSSAMSQDSIKVISEVNTNCQLSIRIPKDELEMFINTVILPLGHITFKEVDNTNVALDQIDYRLQQKDKQTEANLAQSTILKNKNPNETLSSLSSIHEAKRESVIRENKNKLDVEYSQLEISLMQPKTIHVYTTVNPSKFISHDSYPLQFREAFVSMYHSIMTLLVFLVRYLLLIAIFILVCYIILRRKKIKPHITNN